jgi:hypothetical protein
VELQGAGYYPSYNPPQSVGGYLLSRVYFVNCVFSQPSSPKLYEYEGFYYLYGAYDGGAYGSIYIDDDNSTNSPGSQATYPSFVTDFEFRNCEFVNLGVLFRNSTWTDPTTHAIASRFGYVRFEDCRFTGLGGAAFPATKSPFAYEYLGGPGNPASPLLKRGPAQTNSSVALTNPYTYRNNWGFNVMVVVQGGSGVSLVLNGQTLVQTSGIFSLQTGDQLVISYTTAPTVFEIAE